MTFANVPRYLVARLCDSSLSYLINKIESTLEIESTVSEDARQILAMADIRNSVTKLYNRLNFVCRIKELCSMSETPEISLSLSDYAELVSLGDRDKVYSRNNPFPG